MLPVYRIALYGACVCVCVCVCVCECCVPAVLARGLEMMLEDAALRRGRELIGSIATTWLALSHPPHARIDYAMMRAGA